MTTALASRSLADRVARAPRPHDPAQVPPIAARFADLPGTVRALLTGTAGCSPYLAGLMEREAEWLREALAAPPEASLAAILEEAGGEDLAALPARLRVAKRRAALLVALADLGGVWELGEVTGALTRLADRAVQAGLRALVAAEIARGKLPGVTEADISDAAGMFVLAMGKMGAGELNYSSDIDLIVLFDESRHDPDDYAELRRGFIRVTQRLAEIGTAAHIPSSSCRRNASIRASRSRSTAGSPSTMRVSPNPGIIRNRRTASFYPTSPSAATIPATRSRPARRRLASGGARTTDEPRRDSG